MRLTECGVRSVECGIDERPSTPHSALRIPHLLAGALLLALLPRPAGAQQPDSLPKDTTTLAPVVVTGTRLPSVHEIVRGLTGRTATLTSSDLDERGVRSLADALEELPGVTTSDALGAPAQLDVTLRGFQVSPTIGLPQGVTVYVDGVRMNEPDANEVNFDLLPLEDVERVEVMYGPSVLLGRNSLGAAVNLVTRRGSAPGARELELSGGSYGRYEVKLQAGDRQGNWDYYIGARYEHETGWRQATRSGIGTLFGKLGLIAGGWNATLSYSGAENKIHQAGSLPDNVVRSEEHTSELQSQFHLVCRLLLEKKSRSRPASVPSPAPSPSRVLSMRDAWPAIASSTELSTTSHTQWSRPLAPVLPMYIPGRLRS